jgi:hypothetical protein
MRPITVSVGGLAAANASIISASQSVPGAAAVVIDGTYSSGYSANNIATTTGNGANTTTVTLNGSKSSGGIAYLSPAQGVVIVSSGNDSGATITVTGLAADNLTAQSETITGSNASRTATTKIFGQVNSVVLSAGSAGTISVGTNGTAINLQPRKIALTSSGVDTGVNFTITGTDVNGSVLSEVLAGASAGVATSVLVYKTVSSITASGATAGTLTVGTSAVSTSPWVRLDEWAFNGIGIQCDASGTVNYTVQSTYDDPNSPTSPVGPSSVDWVSSSDTAAVGATGGIQTSFTYVPTYVRVLLNSGNGTVTTTIVQSGSVVK